MCERERAICMWGECEEYECGDFMKINITVRHGIINGFCVSLLGLRVGDLGVWI